MQSNSRESNELDESDSDSSPVVFDETLTNQSRIIDAVKRYPILYKTFGRKYPKKRKLLWQEVGKQCKLNGNYINMIKTGSIQFILSLFINL